MRLQNSLKNENKIIKDVKRFFYETFRPRTGNDYKEFFTRGLDGKTDESAAYPWVYTRFFVVFLALFAIITLASFFSNVMSYPTTVLTGGIFTNLTALVLCYELYPRRDLSFLSVILVFLVGMVTSVFIIDIGYYVYGGNGWTGVIWTAVLEEFGKAVPAIIAILCFKNKNPLLGLVVGAAVGAGMSVSEDMGYIFWKSEGGFYPDYTTAVEIAVGRGGSSFFTHILWTAFIGWAFAKFKRPLINFKFWGVCLFSIALHFCWDMPLDEIYLAIVYIACGTAGIAFLVFAVLRKEYKAQTEQVYIELQPAPKNIKIRYSHTANLAAVFSAVILSALSLLTVYINPGYNFITEEFESEAEFISFVQNGLHINADFERQPPKGVPDKDNYSFVKVDGQTVEFTQKVTVDGYDYYYTYKNYFTPGQIEPETLLHNVEVEIDGVRYAYSYLKAEEETYKYFIINDSVLGFNEISYDDGVFYVGTWERGFEGLPWAIALGVVGGAVAVCGASLYIIMKTKSRRINYAQ
ncbi:MAG: PrsW family intramembrane metalloprotease [Clostridia bacterium]|nr:PrsW family intramembrane metalloprotease [Clostridia bacterium]